jgi:hypothetical protein
MDFQNYDPNKKFHAFEDVSNNIIDIILLLILKNGQFFGVETPIFGHFPPPPSLKTFDSLRALGWIPLIYSNLVLPSQT